MNFTFSRNISLAVIVAFLLGGGLYLTTRRRHEALPHQHAAEAKAAIATEDPGHDPNGGNPDHQAAPTEPGREAVVAAAQRPNVFGLSGVVQLADVPEGRFRNELSRLSETARRHALDQLEKLRVPLNDVVSLSADRDGWLFYQCHPQLPPPPVASLAEPNEALAGSPAAPGIIEAAAEVPINAPPLRHSRPGATKVIYLDFNGHSISGSAWNNEKGNPGDANYRPAVASYEAKPFNADGNPNSFSDAEQAVILRVWERVAEDYRGFDVDVTTEEPATFNANTGRILITDNVDANGVNMPSSTGSGVAYIDVFGRANYASYYSPALVYANQDYNYASYIAETASHEMGHNLSLSHDGTASGDEYYNGHGTGETSWNTIMGGAFTENVTQWSKGEYFNANNLEDDLAIIAGHLGYLTDDHADSNGSATPLAVSGLSVSGAGIISQTGEADRFSFESGAGAITLTATTFRSASQSHGGNLDVALELFDVSGSLVASANVDGVTDATLNATVAGGTYYLRVFGAGSGLPKNYSPSGYTNYGSLGQYTISGTVVSTVPIAPSITSQPANQTVYAGQSAQFTVAASGYPAPNFQWQKAAVNINGATSNSFSIASAAPADAGTYSCVVTNSVSSLTSNTATLTVTPTVLPSFISQPASQTITESSTVIFSAVATGVPASTFQWQKGGVNINGAVASSYTITGAGMGSAGSYTVVASNLGGSTTSNAAVLVVNPATRPAFTTQPSSQTVRIGSAITFTAVVSGLPLPTFQWKKEGVNISGATGSSYSIADVAAGDTGNYTMVATNYAGSVTSDIAVLAIQSAPLFTTQPFSQTVMEGTSVNITAIANGAPVPTLQWQKNNVNILGATTATLTFSKVKLIDAGTYTAIATNVAGSATSSSCVLTVDHSIAPAISQQPASVNIAQGAAANFSIGVSGTDPLTYKWQIRALNGADLWFDLGPNGALGGSLVVFSPSAFPIPPRYDGMNSATLQIYTDAAMNGNQYRCMVSNPMGTVTSETAILRFFSGPGIVVQPTSQTVAATQSVTFAPVYSGIPSPTFQWQKNGVNVPGATDSSYTIGSVTLADAGNFRVVTSNPVGSVTSDAAVLTVLAIAPGNAIISITVE